MLLAIGCNAQHKDAQTLSPEPTAKPAAAEPTASSQAVDEELLDTEADSKKFMEKGFALFRAEPVDSSWAPARQTLLQREIENVRLNFPAAVRLGSVECRQKTCLVESQLSDEKSLQPFLDVLHRVYAAANRAAKSEGGGLSMASHPWPNPDGSITHRAYFVYLR